MTLDGSTYCIVAAVVHAYPIAPGDVDVLKNRFSLFTADQS